jgi:uncharacterized damage-inducible protein DinB
MSAHTPFMTAEALLQHWQGHRRLTRRVIDAFPDDQLFTFSIAGMRTFGALAMEILAMTVPTVRGVVSDEWIPLRDHTQRPKHELLAQWDTSTADLDRLWPQIPSQRFAETVTAFGQYTNVVYKLIAYAVDNEIHHRGQGYVYLRALGIEPPPFHVRA